MNIPLSFEKNEGQTDPQVRFLARGQGYSLFLTPAEAVLTMCKSKNTKPQTQLRDVVRMRLMGGNRLCRFEGQEKQSGKSNYFIGPNPEKWRTGIEQYSKVRMSNVYPGIDMVYYGKQSQMEYDFVVQPGADPSDIHLKFEGMKSVSVGKEGNLLIKTVGGNLIFHAPVIYQGEGTEKIRVRGQFLQRARGEVGFELGAYDATKTLVIDPSLIYSTYLGGSDDDFATAIAEDGGGNAYITGQTSGNFPVSAGPYQSAFGGGPTDAFVAKFNVSGNFLLYATYMGGNGTDEGWGIAVNGAGNAFVTGQTNGNFPATGGVVQPAYGGGAQNAFVAELNTFGSALIFSTYLGGSGGSVGYGIVVDGGGEHLCDWRGSRELHHHGRGLPAPLWGERGQRFRDQTESRRDRSALFHLSGWAQYGYETAIALDGAGDAYVTGEAQVNFPATAGTFQTVYGGGLYDAVVAKLNPTGTALLYGTYIGGSGNDFGYAIAVDGAGNAFVTGFTTSPNFPTTGGAYQTVLNGAQDAFVLKLNPAGAALPYSTYLGGNGTTSGQGIAVDPSGNIYVTGSTTGNFPTTPGAIQPAFGGGTSDAFVAVINPVGAGANDLVASTYLGGSGNDTAYGLVLDSSQNVYIAGITSGAFPTTAGAFQTNYGGGNSDAFVAKLSMATPTNTPQPTNTPVPPAQPNLLFQRTNILPRPL